MWFFAFLAIIASSMELYVDVIIIRSVELLLADTAGFTIILHNELIKSELGYNSYLSITFLIIRLNEASLKMLRDYIGVGTTTERAAIKY